MKRAIVLMLIYFVLQNIFGVILVVVAALANINEIKGSLTQESIQTAIMGSNIMTEGLGVVVLLSQILMAWLLLRMCFLKPAQDFNSKISAGVIILCIPLIIGVSYASNCITEFLDLPNLIESQLDSMFNNVFGIAGIVIGAPIVEEMLFRGAIEGHFLRLGKSPAYAILVSALLFGLFHLNPAQIPFATALGCVLGWLYYRTGSLLPSILCHAINNGSAVLLGYLFPEQDTMADLIGNSAVEWGFAVAGLLLAGFAAMLIMKMIPKPKPVAELESSDIFPPKIAYSDEQNLS